MSNLLIDNHNASAYFYEASAKSEVWDWSLTDTKAHKSPAMHLRLFLCVVHTSFGELDGGRLRPAVYFVAVRPTRSAHSSMIGLVVGWVLIHHTKDIVIMRGSHPSCALIVPFKDIVTCVKASRTLVSITQYHLTRTTLPDGGEETLVAAIDKYSALAESLQALIDQHEEACNEL